MNIRVVSYNIHKCIGIDGNYHPERTAATLAEFKPDVLMLQEVDDGAQRSQGHRQVDVLGELLGMPYRAFAVNVTLRSGGGYGNAILSRWPITAQQNLDLTTRLKKRRSVLHAELQLPDGAALHVFNMHLGLAQYERKLQLTAFLQSEILASVATNTPVVVAGDFNDVWGNLHKRLLPQGFRCVEKPPRTFPARLPMRALDSLYVRGHAHIDSLFCGDTNHAKVASDHRPLVGNVVLRHI
jgi:endonuclease/exonuclease/phosphatase family metal-dependent hydrolase